MTDEPADLSPGSVLFLRLVLIASVPLGLAVVWFVANGDADAPAIAVVAIPFAYIAFMPRRLRRQVLGRTP